MGGRKEQTVNISLYLLATITLIGASDTPRPNLDSNACMKLHGTYTVQVKELHGNCGVPATSYSYVHEQPVSYQVFCDSTLSNGCYYQFDDCCTDRFSCTNHPVVISGYSQFAPDGSSGTETEKLHYHHCDSEYQFTYTRVK